MATTTLSACDLRFRYRGTLALAGASFALGQGVTGLLGPNGAGKTTLLRILATALSRDSGELSVCGYRPDSHQARREIRRRLGYMPQDPGFHPSFTTFEFVEYVAILKEITNRGSRRREVERVLNLVGLLEQRRKRVKTLSGGMRQRMALAAALVGDPELLILDEPMVGLDPEQRLRLRELVADLGETRTVILSTHQTEDVMSLCQRVIVLNRGETVFQGEPAELANIASGTVWISATRGSDSIATWRTGTGHYRNIGRPPEGAALVDPTLEDGYIMLLGGRSQAAPVPA